MQAASLVLSWIVTTALLFAVVILDERRLPPEQLERAWPPSSRTAALVAFGILALPIHFMRTRGNLRSLRGALGVAWGFVLGGLLVLVVALIDTALLTAIAYVTGLPLDE